MNAIEHMGWRFVAALPSGAEQPILYTFCFACQSVRFGFVEDRCPLCECTLADRLAEEFYLGAS